MKTLEERREQTMLENPVFLLQINEDQYHECLECNAEVEVDNWKTDRVCLTAEEAEAFAIRKNYGKRGIGWQIRPVPAQGELCKRLELPVD